MVARGLVLLVALGSLLTWAAVRRPTWVPRALANQLWGLKCRLETDAIRWSGALLHTMGAVESSPRAELDALLAHRVACALAERLDPRTADLRVMVIGRVVHLEGSVGSVEERTVAERAALEVSGAQVIADDLRVE